MADSAVAITAGTGTNVDTRTESTNGNHRQVVVLGDPATNAGVAPVDAIKGLAVDLSATGANSNAILATLATQPVIASGNLGVIGGSLSAFQGGNWLVSVATLPVVANINNTSIPVTQSGTWDEVGINDSGNSITIDGNVGVIGGSLTAFQGSAPWKMTMATLPVMAEVVNTVPVTGTFFQATQPISGTVQPGNTPNTVGWLVTMATLPVVGDFALSGDVGVAGGSISTFNAGGSLSAFQGGAWNVGNIGGSLSAFQGGNWLVSVATLPVVAAQAGTWSVTANAGTNLNTSSLALESGGNLATIASNLNVTLGSRLASGATLPVTGDLGSRGIGGSISVFQGTPFWQVTMATLPVVGDFTVSSVGQGSAGSEAWLATLATLPVIASGNLGVIGGSLTAFQGSAPWLVTFATLPAVVNINNSSIPVTQSGTWTIQPGNTPNTTAWLVTMATLPVVGEFSVAGQATVTALQGNAGSSPWLVTMATLPVIANVVNTITADVTGQGDVPITLAGETVVLGAGSAAFGKLAANSGVDIGDVDIASIAAGDNNIGNVDAIQSGTWTVQPGNTPNTTAWLVTSATLSIRGNVGVIGGSLSSYIFGGSLSAFNAGGSLSAFQGGGWLVSTISGSSVLTSGQYLPSNVSLTSQQLSPLKIDMFNNLMVNTNVPLPNSTKINRFYTLASMASLMAAPGAGRRLIVRELDFSANATVTVKLVEDQGGTPATVWGPHYFLPYAGVTKTQSYIPLTANKSLGLDVQPGGFNAGIDVRVEIENT